ncbi:uncharacterized protein si:dkey-97a13.12 [Anoplopoma fimbria]|uniref:uncharacterized protein si:dkey-97a13.12 n=1 Tax=Anoplopoma fimbria TaxID=229290 RepID=UPI0023EA988B|nr:uncharacterized protein si:dkey-97a13.12 [Anoplopoma fimbria]
MQIYRQTDEHFEVYTTVFSPKVSRTRTRTGSGTGTRHVEAEKVVAVMQHRSSWQKELDLNQGDLIQVLFKEDESWWFGRLSDGTEGYFLAACVEPLQVTTPTRPTGSTGSTGPSGGGFLQKLSC